MILGLAAWALASDPSEAQTGTMQDCPPAGLWSIAVWDGASGTAAADALATCGEGAVAAAYSLDAQTGVWSRWFAANLGVSDLTSVDDMQGLLALGSATGPVATPTLMATVTPTPTVVPTEAVEVLNYRSHQSEYGSLQFYGEVGNNGSTEVASVEVVLTLLDGAGKVIGTGSAYTDPGCLSPGERGAFAIYVSDPPSAWANERIQVQWSPISEWLRDMCYEAFSVSGTTVTSGEYGGLVVRGQVTNTGTEAATLTEMTFVGYDTAGKVLVVDSSFADVDPLAPGNSSPFEIWISELDAPPASYGITAEAWAQ
jgi:hypothetical protein